MSFRNYSDSTSYGRSRDTGRTNTTSTSTERPTTVTAKYINATPSYKSSSIPILSHGSERSSSKDETPISIIASRYANYNKPEKSIPKYEKKDYSKLSIPSITTSRDKSRDASPVSATSKYSLTRPSRHLSPDRRTVKTFKEKSRDISPKDLDKNIPSKTEKSTGYSSLSNYKLYPRTSSYTRPAIKTESKPEVTVNRYAIASRLSTSYLRSPPTVKRTSVSPVHHVEAPKTAVEKITSPTIVVEEIREPQKENEQDEHFNDLQNVSNPTEIETLTVITRHTSPTPPGSSAYVRSRRADMAKTIEKTITRIKNRPQMCNKEVQSDRLDDPTRASRFGSASRTSTTNWSYYSPSSNNYTGYAGRYSTQYSTLRENSNGISYNDRSSRSRSTERTSADFNNSTSNSDSNKEKNICHKVQPESSEDVVAVCEQNKSDDTSEIIINVNLKLKRAKSPTSAPELVSPEITITNSQLPPQAPKADAVTKLKKPKIRKSSTDSSTDSISKKKVIKRRSKSASSTDSDLCAEQMEKSSIASNKSLQKTSSNNLQNGPKLKHSKSRDSNSPESSITLSTQSSVSEDENLSKTHSKTQELSRTSADEISIPTDRSGRQTSPHLTQNNGAEEAKSFLIRALAPVTNLFKMKHSDSCDSSRWPENSNSESTSKDVSNLITESDKSSKSKNIIASNDDGLVRLKAIRSVDSGDRSRWLESDSDKKFSPRNNHQSSSDKNIPKMIRHVESGERAWWLDSSSDSKKDQVQVSSTDSSDPNQAFKKYKLADEEKPWWLDSNANIPEGIERLTPPRKSTSESDKNEKYNFFKVRRIESGDQKDWWLTSNENSLSGNKLESHSLSKSGSDRSFPLRRIRHIESGERPWWLSSDKNIPEGIEKLPTPPPQQESDSSDSEEVQVYIPPSHVPPFPLHLPDDEPLGDRRSPEGLETPRENENYRGRTSPYENNRQCRRRSSANAFQKVDRYISRYTDIDDILGTSGQIYSPFMDSILARRTGQTLLDEDVCEEIDPTQVRIHDSTAQRPVIKKIGSRSDIIDYNNEDQLDDATLQVFKDGDYGPYLDLDSTLGEQDEELEGLQDNRKNALVLRTQLSVRVHSIMERLLHSQGRELRRALFSLKQILQSDKDLVHEFVANKGLDCLMQVSNMADHNYLDYILRALGQILLYVDGMHGVMGHEGCIQWLYSLISSKFRHVVKTALKLLLVFVEYTEKNCLLLIDAIIAVDGSAGYQPWHNIMKILQDFDASDTELLIYATTLINRCLNNVPDRDTYYDQVDALQDQGMDDIIQLYMTKQGTDLDLLRQLQIFEAVLLYEDGDESGTALQQLDESVISLVRRRSLNLNTSEMRKSKKQQMREKARPPVITHPEPETKIANNQRTSFLPSIMDNKENKDLSAALRRRRDRYARQAHHIIQQQEMLNNSNTIYNGLFGATNGTYSTPNGTTNGNCNGTYTSIKNYSNGSLNGNHYANGVNGHLDDEEPYANRTTRSLNQTDALKNGNQRYTAGLKQRIQNGTLGHSVSAVDALAAMRQKQLDSTPEAKDDRGIIINREHSIKDLAQRLTSPVSPTTEEKPLRVSEMAGIVSKAKEELAKSQSKEVIKSPTIEKSQKVHEIKVSENDIHWEELKKGCLNREFHLCDLDFSDLRHDSEDDMLYPAVSAANGPPPPPPGMFPPIGAPPPLPGCFPIVPKNNVPIPPKPSLSSELSNNSDSSTIKKNKKTVKLFWKEIQENPVPVTVRPKVGGFIWDDLPSIDLDTAMLEHLFESRTNDLIIKV
ncbi:uncharacterized protein LOC101739187 [Bombyx mori]|uniref:GBD/FH3 domain-containing protein n=1 Tax=Bombyx mori TaxID=7091 RepID=A0A8R2QR70_BOMMO|nr:uncharacterized protein LOC101739187 isoform X1 [Bombyx mori]XP_037866588.1 uncharacterized protein LOC101739187 isoform X1 [Bombyx mori]